MLTGHPALVQFLSALYLVFAAYPLALVVKPKYCMMRCTMLRFRDQRQARQAGLLLAVVAAIGYVFLFVPL